MYEILLEKIAVRGVEYITPVSIDLYSGDYGATQQIIGVYPGKADELVEAIIEGENLFIPIILPSISYNVTYIKVVDIYRFDLLNHESFKQYTNMLPKTSLDSRLLNEVIYTKSSFKKEDDEDNNDALIDDVLIDDVLDYLTYNKFDNLLDNDTKNKSTDVSMSIKLIDISEDDINEIFKK